MAMADNQEKLQAWAALKVRRLISRVLLLIQRGVRL